MKAEHCQSLKDEEETETLGKLELWFAQVGICRRPAKQVHARKDCREPGDAWSAEQ